MAIERGINYPKTLGEIAMSHYYPITLPLEGYSLLVDGRLVFKFFSMKRNPYNNRLLVISERQLPIITQRKNNSHIYIPYSEQEKETLLGKVDITVVDLKVARPVLYIGDQYRVTLTDKNLSSISFKLESLSPIKDFELVGPYPGDIEHLKSILESKP